MESRTNQAQKHSNTCVLFDNCSESSSNLLEKSCNGDFFFSEIVGREILRDIYSCIHDFTSISNRNM